MKLTFGVDDVPYAAALPAAAKRAARWRAGKRPWQRLGGFTTTGDVAEILERRYGVMATFYARHGQEIADELTETVAGKLENLMMGGPQSGRAFEEGDLSGVEQMFRAFLDNREMDGAPGVPTGAAQRGVNNRLAHPYVKGNPARPSFINTGLYSASMRAQITE
jgi:hypothetical protein